MNEYLSPPSLERRKKRFLTKSVYPPWYIRYADILPESEKVYLQPIREIKEEQAMIQALRTPPKEKDKTEELVKKLEAEKKLKIETVLFLIQGDSKNLKEKIANIKPLTSPLKYNSEMEKQNKERMERRERLERLHDAPQHINLFPNSRWKKLRENKVIRTKLATLIKEHRIARITHRWQRAIRNVRAVNRFARVIAKIARTTSEVFKKFKKLTEKAYKDETGLFFDKSYYKTTTTGRALDRNTIFTLSKPERYRTWEEAHKAAINLRFLKTFSALPLHHQDKIAMIGWFAKISPDKVIIRQGHVADSFYYVMYGKAVAVQLDGSAEYEDYSGFSLIKSFGSHDLIGEEGISNRELRTYTVSTVETCGLLCVNIDDYHRIFATSLTEDENPDHIRFLSQLDFMRYFPINVLIENNEGNVIVYYYRKQAVVTRTTSASNYFYIIKEGTCLVMAEVVQTVARDKFKCMKYVLPPIPAGSQTQVQPAKPPPAPGDASENAQAEEDSLPKLTESVIDRTRNNSVRPQDLESEASTEDTTSTSSGRAVKLPSLRRPLYHTRHKEDKGIYNSIPVLPNRPTGTKKVNNNDQSGNAKSDCGQKRNTSLRTNTRSTVRSARDHGSKSLASATNSAQTTTSRNCSSQRKDFSSSRGRDARRNRSLCETNRHLELNNPKRSRSTTLNSASKATLEKRNKCCTDANNSGQKSEIPGVHTGALDKESKVDRTKRNRNTNAGKRKKHHKNKDLEEDFFILKKRTEGEKPSLSESEDSFGLDDSSESDDDDDDIYGEEHKAIYELERFTSVYKSNTIAHSIRKSGYSRGSNTGSIDVVRPLQKAGSVEKVLINKNKKQKLESTWICLRTLTESDVFGIEDLDLGDHTDSKRMEVSIVSEGAEVILFSKKFFLDNASPKMKAHLRACSYIMPDEDFVSLELQKLRYWNRFKEKTVTSIYKEMGITLDEDYM